MEQNHHTTNVRNLSIAAHIDSGKTTLTDAFALRGGLISANDAGNKRFADNRPDEQERGITIKATGISLDIRFEEQDYHINLIDTPGHVDFGGNTQSALRITDGVIVVIDAVNGVEVQTGTVLRQALAEQVKPILFINKMDRYIFELQLTPNEVYDRLVTIIDQMNQLISTYQSKDSELKLELSPALGNVFFGSAKDGWGFGVHTFARMLAKKTNADESVYMKKLWGDNFFDPETKKMTNQSTNKNGKMLERTFCRFVLEPIWKIVKSITNHEIDNYSKMLEAVEVKLNAKDMENSDKDIYRIAMRKFLPLAESLLYGIVHHLPSPKQAQSYRYTTLYDGPIDDECALAIKNCDPNGPLMLYVSMMIQDGDSGRFFAFGRIFSGTVKTSQKVRILGSNYKFGFKDDSFSNKAIQRVVKMVGNKAETCDSVQCGNTVALIGIDQYVLKTCTITTHDQAHPIKTMKFSVSPVVRVSVSPKNMSELPKLVEGLTKLSKSDPCVQIIITEEGEHIVAGVGELHVEICLNDLRDFMKSEIKVSDPVVPLRETVINTSNQICLAKSPNKHNRLYMSAEPIHKDLVDKMDSKEITIRDDVNTRSKILVTEFGWDPNDSKKIWTIGPEGDNGTNMCVEVAKGVQYLHEIKDHVIGGFNWATGTGPLCGEPMRGVRFNLHDVTLHADTIHRGGSQIIPVSRRVLYASLLTAQPRLLEPVFLVEIQVPDNYVGTIYSCLAQKRGRVISEEKSVGSLNIIKGYLPVRNSFGFNGYIRQATSGQAFPQMVFDHWEIIDSDPLDVNSEAGKLVREVRKRKGLKENIPDLSEYLDKL